MFGISRTSPGLTSLHVSYQEQAGPLHPAVFGVWLSFFLPVWEGGCLGGSQPPHSGLEAPSRCVQGLAGPCLCSVGRGPVQAGREGVALWLRSGPSLLPSLVTARTATGVGGAGQAEQAGGQGRDEKALHGGHKGCL